MDCKTRSLLIVHIIYDLQKYLSIRIIKQMKYNRPKSDSTNTGQKQLSELTTHAAQNQSSSGTSNNAGRKQNMWKG